jgi:hypothetical protein
MLGAASGYLKENPEELLRAAKNAVGLRFGLPISALRWLVAQLNGARAPKNVELEAVPPGIRIGANVELMQTPIRVAATLYFSQIALTQESLKIELRLSDVSLKVLDESADSPIAALIRSGALDLSRPGNLVAYMPKRPPFLVEAIDDRVVLDLMKHQKLSRARARRIVQLLTPLIVVKSIETDEAHLDIALAAFPQGVSQAVSKIRRFL